MAEDFPVVERLSIGSEQVDAKKKKAVRKKSFVGPGAAGLGSALGMASASASACGSSSSSNGGNNGTANQNLSVPDRLKFELDDDDVDDEEEDSKRGEADTVEKKDAGEAEELQSGRFTEFESWLADNGAQFPDLYLKKYTGDVRGVHAKRRIGPYECLIQIPLKCLITDHMGKTETELGRKLFAQNYNLSTPNLIAVIVYILTTREDPSHFFQPYYRILPKNYDNFPIFWNQEQLSWLQGSPLGVDIEDRKKNMRADYNEIVRLCPEFARFSFEEFLEVRTCVGSRNFGIVVHGQKRTAMVPYSDMLNHFRPRETSWTFESSKDAFTITSLCPLVAGQQVMDSYGRKCNSKFLLHYGFAVINNREEDDAKCQNETLVRLGLRSPSQDPLFELRLALLGPSRSSRGFRLSMNIEDKATVEALAFCRVAVASEAELTLLLAAAGDATGASGSGSGSGSGSAAAAIALGGAGGAGAGAGTGTGTGTGMRARYQDGHAHRDQPVGFVSARNETAALEMLARACDRLQDGYPDSYDDNLRLLQHGDLKPFGVRSTALIVVLGEQEILRFWVHACEVVSDALVPYIAETQRSRAQAEAAAEAAAAATAAGQSGAFPAPLHQVLRAFPRETPRDNDVARYASKIAYEIRASKH